MFSIVVGWIEFAQMNIIKDVWCWLSDDDLMEMNDDKKSGSIRLKELSVIFEETIGLRRKMKETFTDSVLGKDKIHVLQLSFSVKLFLILIVD